jgi:fumarate hydratase subunit alpha
MEAREIAEVLRVLETDLPSDIEEALQKCALVEDGNSREVMKAIVENITYARKMKVPICQDTGTLVFFVTCNNDLVRISKSIEEGIALATEAVPLRANTVNPFTRENSGDNLGKGNPIIHFEGAELEPGDVDMAIMAKGAGSENVSRIFSLDPDQGIKGIKDGVLDAIEKAGAKPCPPIIVGVGIGGTLEWSAHLAKKALLRPLGDRAEDLFAAKLERELLEEINKLGIGPMGFGGKTTALGVKVEWAYCHTASLPVAVNIQCWALRRVRAQWHKGKFSILR